MLLIPLTAYADDEQTFNVERTDEPTVKIIDRPTTKLAKNWVFVVDTSDSMEGVFHKALKGWRYLTQNPTDEWFFCVYVFNNKGQTKHTKWLASSPENFEKAEAWVEHPRQRGVNSNGKRAIEQALRIMRSELSIVLITDGGFTSACDNRGFGRIRKTIISGQAWRRANSLHQATITSIGVSNSHYSAWCLRCIRGIKTSSRHNYALPDHWRSNKGKKPSDNDCQAFLREIGTAYAGGYLLVRHREPPVATTAPSGRAVLIQPTVVPSQKK
jgi:hypothetical protein